MLEELAVSAAMAVQDQCGGSRSNSVLQAGNGVPLNSGLHVVTGSLHKEQFSCGNDFSPKVRKPYTITKQRERWTEEEHKKFLEALKLYGRAWRRIEEHVGSKTAVQIRSHAQKFFSKVVRESSGTTASPEEPIEIPPPRPKRKPTHPYPRKMVNPLTKEALASENRLRSSSPNLSVSEHENQSPSSVLSVVCSDALGSTDSNMPNCSQSPVSCADASHSANLTISEINLGQTANDEQSPKKLNLFVKEDVSEDGLVEETSTRSLKLFGRTVLITECHGDRARGSPKPLPTRTTDVRFLQASGSHYYLQFQNENSNRTEESGYAAARPWWALYGGLLSPIGAFPKQETVKVILGSSEEFQEKQIQKEGSSTGSNSGSSNGEENVESYNGEKAHNPIPEPKPIERSASSKGFVPYKKRAYERDNKCLTGEEREDKHLRLSL